MFLLKKFLSACLLPFPLSVLLVTAGAVLLWVTKRDRLGRWLTSAGALLLLASGYGALSQLTLRPLERPYLPLSAESLADLSPPPRIVAVLGSGYRPDRGLPANDRIGATGLARLVEGVRLWRLLPDATLVLSNGLGQGEAVAETASVLGVPANKLMREDLSMDTVDETAAIKKVVGTAPFLLVTSAAHMRRSMALAQRQGMRPIAAPTDFLTAPHAFTVLDLVPAAGQLGRVDRAIHEWLGLLWARLRGDR